MVERANTEIQIDDIALRISILRKKAELMFIPISDKEFEPKKLPYRAIEYIASKPCSLETMENMLLYLGYYRVLCGSLTFEKAKEQLDTATIDFEKRR